MMLIHKKEKQVFWKCLDKQMYSPATGQFGKKHHGFRIVLDLKIVRQIHWFISHANVIHVWYIRLHEWLNFYGKLQYVGKKTPVSWMPRGMSHRIWKICFFLFHHVNLTAKAAKLQECPALVLDHLSCDRPRWPCGAD